MEVPVVASNVSGIPDIVQHDRTGWLFEPDDENTMAELIVHALSGSKEVDRVVDAARVKARQYYNSHRYGREAAEAYSDLLDGAVVT